jgi:hypothetical protein
MPSLLSWVCLLYLEGMQLIGSEKLRPVAIPRINEADGRPIQSLGTLRLRLLER